MAHPMDPADDRRATRDDDVHTDTHRDRDDADLPLPQDPGGEEAGPMPDEVEEHMTEDSLGIQHEHFNATERLDAVESRIEALRNDDEAGTPQRPAPADPGDPTGAAPQADGTITSARDDEAGDPSRPANDPAAQGPAGDPTAGQAGAVDSGRVPDQGAAADAGGLGAPGGVGGSGRAPDGGNAMTT
jgi:hypothetical protein